LFKRSAQIFFELSPSNITQKYGLTFSVYRYLSDCQVKPSSEPTKEPELTNNFRDNEFSELGITVSSLDKTFKRLLKPFSRLIGRYTFASDKPEIFKGVNYTHNDVAYAPCRMKTTRALKRRFIDFWQKDWRGKKSAIMMLDIDQENVSPDIWATAGLRKPLFTISNAVYGTCQIVYIMEQQVYKEEYYQIRQYAP
jgi:hypothetical protein